MFEAVNPASYSFNPYAIPNSVVSTLILLVGIFVFLQNRKSATHLCFFLFCLCLNFWLYGISLVYCSTKPAVALFWYRWITFLGVSYISPLVYTFSILWLGLYERRKKFVWLSFPIAALFYLFAVATPYGMPAVRRYFWGYYPIYGSAGRIFLIFFFGYFLAAFYNLFSVLKHEPSPLRKTQIRLIAIAFMISITGSVDYLPKLMNLSFYPFGYLSVFAWILIVAYLIVRYRVMDIQTVIHKTIMWGLTSLLFALPVVLFSYFGRDWLFSLKSGPFAAIVFALIVFFTLYARFVQPAIDHVFQRRRWDLAQAFESFTDELGHLKDLNELSGHIVDTIQKVFYVREISLLLGKEGEERFACVRSIPAGQQFVFEGRHRFLSWLETHDVLTVREFVDIDPKFQAIREEARDYFDQVNAALALPLVVDRRLLGIINMGQKANLKRFRNDEINFLSDLRKTAAIALSNTLRSIAMQENLRRWNVELEKKVEERTKELKETQAQLIQAEKLATIGTLAGGVAHEINNPLTAVLTNVQMLRMSNQIEDRESLTLIEEGAKRCQGIIQKLMKYARKTEEVEATEAVDVNRVIRVVSDFLGYQLKQENVELKLSLNPTCSISGIANELEQVFTNLILNSRDAIKSAGRVGKIEIKTGLQNGFVQVEVKDNGCGIKRENLARIFDPFYTTKDVGEGTGLGLTVSSGIVEKHLGKISVSSEVGKGTTFLIQFPAVKEQTQAVKP